MADTAPEPKDGAQEPKGDAQEEPKEAIPAPQATAEPKGLSMSLADIVKSSHGNRREGSQGRNKPKSGPGGQEQQQQPQVVLMNHHNQPHRRDHQRRPGPQRGMDAFQVQSMQGMPPMYMSMVPPGFWPQGFRGPAGMMGMPPMGMQQGFLTPGPIFGMMGPQMQPSPFGMRPSVAAPLPKPDLTAVVRPETREVVVMMKQKEILRVNEAGQMTLSSGSFKGPMLLAALRECLSAVGMKMTAAGADQWSITVGSALMRFHDGMVIAARGPDAPDRARKVLAKFNRSKPPAQDSGAPEPSGRQPESSQFAGDALDNGFGHAVSTGTGGSHQAIGSRQNGWHNPNRQGFQPEKGPIRMTDQQRRLHAKGRYTPY